MAPFPRTVVGGLSLSRMIIGTNWFLGFSHTTPSKDEFICTQVRERKAIADIIEVFLRAGVDTLMGLIAMEPLADAIKEAEDRTLAIVDVAKHRNGPTGEVKLNFDETLTRFHDRADEHRGDDGSEPDPHDVGAP